MVFAVIASASAESPETRGAAARPAAMPTTGVGMMMVPPTITTGDVITDTKIKALQIEMETKIKAIRDEYQGKIKVLIGDKKVNSGNDMMNRGSSTVRMGSPRMEDRNERRGTSTMMHREGEMMNGSGTPEGRPEMRGEGQVPGGKQVKDESTEGGSEQAAPKEGGFRGFFNKFFGR